MEIQKAEEKDIIEALYLIKTAFDYNNVSKNEWRPPTPAYSEMREEANNEELYLLRDQKITFGTFTFTNELPENFKHIEWTDTDKNVLVIKRIAIFPGWFTKEVGEKLISFIEEYAKKNNIASIKSNTYSRNESMNELYKNMGFTFQGDVTLPGKEMPYYFYEKVFK